MLCNACILNIISKVTGVTQSTLTAMHEKQVVNKATLIPADDTHMLHAYYYHSAIVSKDLNCHL